MGSIGSYGDSDIETKAKKFFDDMEFIKQELIKSKQAKQPEPEPEKKPLWKKILRRS